MICCAVYLLFNGHPNNFLYDASLVTVDGVRHGFYYSTILILRPPKWCIIRATVAKSTISIICKCYWNILVSFCWFQLAIRVDRRQSWWKINFMADMCAAFSSDVAIFWLTQVAVVYFIRVCCFKNTQNICKSKWWRENDIVLAWYDFSPGKWTHASAQNI